MDYPIDRPTDAYVLESADAIGDDWSRYGSGGDPFVSPAFLGEAEKVGAGDTAGDWIPRHLALPDEQGNVAALMPLYLRTRCGGDFAGDDGWPAIWHQAGREYFPKLVCGVPHTPSPGPRLLVRPDLDRADWAPRLVAAADHAMAAWEASGWQCQLVEEADRAVLAGAGLLLRRGVQFHWRNRGYRDFDDYLSAFPAKKRAKLRHERRTVAASGLRIETHHGDEIDASLWPAIHRHYRSTFLRHGNRAAFPPDFFARLAARLGRQMLVFIAFDGDTAVASAVCFRDDTTLYLRHWGSDGQYRFLHFELGLYRGIDYCIACQLDRFEPGAGGEHKIARGFEPTDTWWAYRIADPALRRAAAEFLGQEAVAAGAYIEEARHHLPFKTGNQP